MICYGVLSTKSRPVNPNGMVLNALRSGSGVDESDEIFISVDDFFPWGKDQFFMEWWWIGGHYLLLFLLFPFITSMVLFYYLSRRGEVV